MARFIVLAIVFLMVSCVLCSDHDDDDDHDHNDFKAVEFCSARLAPGVNETHCCHPDDTSCGVVCKRDGANVTGTIVECDEDKDQFYSATAKKCVGEGVDSCETTDVKLKEELPKKYTTNADDLAFFDDFVKETAEVDKQQSTASRPDAGEMRVGPNGQYRDSRIQTVLQGEGADDAPIYPANPPLARHGDPRVPPQSPQNGAVCRTRYLHHPEKADWEGAKAICELEGGQLAVITSEADQNRIMSRFGKLREFWIGATDIEREGQFRWVNGQGLGFARWLSGQPTRKYPNNEHCVSFNYAWRDGKWGDRNCYDSRPFLCETMVCKPARGRFPSGYPGAFKGPLRSPYHFPRNRNHPGPKGMGGQAVRSWSRGGGQPYNEWERIRTAIHN